MKGTGKKKKKKSKKKESKMLLYLDKLAKKGGEFNGKF